MTTIRFNVKAQRYINEKGQFIKEEKVLETLENYRTQRQLVIDKYVETFLNSDTPNYNTFLSDIAKEIKNLWFVHYVVGKGGVKSLDNEDIKILNQELQRELTLSFDPVTGSSYGLQELVTQYELGEISSAQLTARVKAYVRGSKKAYWKGVASRQKLRYMRRFLNGTDNCAECIAYASVGMVPKDQLPLPGYLCSCRSNCNCTVTYYSERQYNAYLKSQLNSFADAVLST